MASTGRFTAAQRAAILAGGKIVQTWHLLVPENDAHTAWDEVPIHNRGYSTGTHDRVLRAGTRKHTVWNPSPNAHNTPKAVRYIFTVRNDDGIFYEASSDNIYYFGGVPARQAQPNECRVLHRIYIWDPAAGSFDKIDHMDFTGGIIELRHEDTADPNGNPTGAITIITTEQVDAWAALRRIWTIDDATDHPMTNNEPGGLDYTWTVT